MNTGRFFCSDEKSRKVIKDARNNPNKRKDDWKFLAKVGAIISAVTIFAGFTYAHFTSSPEYIEKPNTQYSDQYIADNATALKEITTLMRTYSELHKTKPLSVEFVKTMETINSKYPTIRSLALANVKAKYGDMLNINPNDLTLDVSLKHGEYDIRQSKRQPDTFKEYTSTAYSADFINSSPLEETVLAIANLPSPLDKGNDDISSLYPMSKQLYNLHRSSMHTAEHTYVLKDGTIVELPPIKSKTQTNKPVQKPQQKDADRDR